MKKLLLLLLTFSSLTLTLRAQQIDQCTVDAVYQDTLPGVYPLPYEPDLNPTGGITDTACLNEDFQFVFTLVVNDTITISGASIPIDSITLDTEGAISNLPQGMDYACNPPSCSFVKNSQGCVVIYGKATNPADVGNHELEISGFLFSPFTPQGAPLQFPNPDLAAGTYTLTVMEQGSPSCSIWVDVNEPISQIESFRNLPNPFSGNTTFEIITKQAGEFTLTINDPMGRQISTRSLSLIQGLNHYTFDATGIAPGIYLYTLSDGQTHVSGRMVIQ